MTKIKKSDQELFHAACRRYRELGAQIAELKNEQTDEKETAEFLAEKYGITNLKTSDYHWMQVGESKGGVNADKLQQNLLRAGLGIDTVNDIIEASRNKPRAAHYQIREGGE